MATSICPISQMFRRPDPFPSSGFWDKTPEDVNVGVGETADAAVIPRKILITSII